MDRSTEQEANSHSVEFAPKGPISLLFRPPERSGTAYRLIAEISGKRATSGQNGNEKTQSSRNSHLLQLEYREIPMLGSEAREGHFQLRLDGLRHKFEAAPPITKSETELWQDRMMLRHGDQTTLDIKGEARHLTVKPRAFLKRIFGRVIHDKYGSPLAASASGSPSARKFLASMPIWGAVIYSRFAFPEGPVTQGSQWTSVRHPPGWVGEFGVEITIRYTLVGFATVDDVLTAVVRLRGESKRKEFQLTPGTSISGVMASLQGTAWIDVETFRVRRMITEDTIKLLVSSPGPSGSTIRSRIEQENRITLELRDPQKKPRTWSDGARRFGSR
jgi:hypothetical protein